MYGLETANLFFKEIVRKREKILLPWFEKYWPEKSFLSANALCFYRIALSLYIIVLLFLSSFTEIKTKVFLWFIIGAFLDFFDGLIARAKKKTSSFGAFLDRLADKLLVCPILFLFLWNLSAKFTAGFLIFLEITSIGIAFSAKKRGINISSNWTGKWKMAVQVILVFMIFFVDAKSWQKYNLIYWVWLTMGLSLGSFIGHLQDYWQIKKNDSKVV